jgi:hypothetical protein
MLGGMATNRIVHGRIGKNLVHDELLARQLEAIDAHAVLTHRATCRSAEVTRREDPRRDGGEDGEQGYQGARNEVLRESVDRRGSAVNVWLAVSPAVGPLVP